MKLCSGFVIARRSCTMRGYLSTFHEYVQNLKHVAKKLSSGTIVMDDSEPAVQQLRDDVAGCIEAMYTNMKDCKNCLGFDKNGILSLVAAQYNNPTDLHHRRILEMIPSSSKTNKNDDDMARCDREGT